MKLPREHVAAHEAVLIIQKLFAEAQCVSEIVTNDYGEDIHIQPSQKGNADPFLIAAQVKGINKNTNRPARSVRVSMKHLRRWHDSLLPVMLCAHDFSSGISYITTAKRFETRWEYADTSRAYKSIPLSDFDILTPERALQEVWHCRFDYYERTMYIIMGRLEEWWGFREDCSEIDNTPADIHIFSTEILHAIGIFVIDGGEGCLHGDFLSSMDEKYLELSYREDLSIFEIIMLSILQFVQDYQRIGMPFTLLKWLIEAAGFWFKALHQSDWARLQEIVPVQWQPYKAQ